MWIQWPDLLEIQFKDVCGLMKSVKFGKIYGFFYKHGWVQRHAILFRSISIPGIATITAAFHGFHYWIMSHFLFLILAITVYTGFRLWVWTRSIVRHPSLRKLVDVLSAGAMVSYMSVLIFVPWWWIFKASHTGVLTKEFMVGEQVRQVFVQTAHEKAHKAPILSFLSSYQTRWGGYPRGSTLVYSFLHFHVTYSLCISLYSNVFQVFPCIPVYSHVFSCIPSHSYDTWNVIFFFTQRNAWERLHHNYRKFFFRANSLFNSIKPTNYNRNMISILTESSCQTSLVRWQPEPFPITAQISIDYQTLFPWFSEELLNRLLMSLRYALPILGTSCFYAFSSFLHIFSALGVRCCYVTYFSCVRVI